MNEEDLLHYKKTTCYLPRKTILMGIKSTAVGQQLLHELSVLSGIVFQKKCFDYLSELIPDLRYAAELKKVDRKGVDIYQLSNRVGLDYGIAFQCKGLEERFDKSQYDQCVASIQKLRASGVRVGKYYMVLNLKSKYFDISYRRELTDRLKELVKDKVVKSAELLDGQGLVQFLGKLVKQKLSVQITKANQRFARDYVHSMNQQFYYESIPFKIGTKIQQNASDYIISRTIDLASQALHSKRKNWIFVISEFGFGKTSLLFHLFDRIKKHKQRCLYVPVSLFSKDDFLYTSQFANQLLKIIDGEDIDFTQTYNRFRSRVLHYQMQNQDDQFILMMDGLDEHEELFNHDVLKIFFNHISLFKCPILFTVRKEMWDERQGNFTEALGKGSPQKKVKLFLHEWDNEEILAYLGIHIKAAQKDSAAKTNLLKFKTLVEEGRYEQYYGDIPKRPLFLEMLISDIRINKIQHRNISEIYSVYLRNKFLLDRQGAFGAHTTKRPLSVREDNYKTFGIIFSILARVASKMVIGVDKTQTMILSSYIEEIDLERILTDSGISKTIELALHSVLVPFGIRVNNNITLKFAHKSFQEFFLARAIYEQILYGLENATQVNDLNTIHSEGVSQFLAGFIQSDFPPDLLPELKASIAQHYPAILPNSLAAVLTAVKPL